MNHRSHDEQELSHVQQKCSESGSKPHDEIQNVGAIDATALSGWARAAAELAGAAAREAASSRSSCRSSGRCNYWRSHRRNNRSSHPNPDSISGTKFAAADGCTVADLSFNSRAS